MIFTKKMKKHYIFLIIFLLTAVGMYFTNPSPEKHREAIFSVLAEVLKDKKQALEKDGFKMKNLLQNLNDESMTEMVKPFVEQAVKVEDYKVFSISKIDLGTNVYPVGIGVFGMVFIAPQMKSKIKENLDKYL